MKLFLFIFIALFISCSVEVSNNEEPEISINQNEISENETLEPYIEYDSLGRLLAEGFLNEQGLYEGELLIYSQDHGVVEKLIMHNDTMIGYIVEYDTNGVITGYKNYKSPSIMEKGHINELLLLDSTGNNYLKLSIYVDIKNCFKNDSLLETGRIKILPYGAYNVQFKKFNNDTDSTIIDCKKVSEGEFEVNFNQLNLVTGDTVIFYLDYEHIGKNNKPRKGGGEVIKILKVFDFYTPQL